MQDTERVQNIYPDEQVKLDDAMKAELELSFKISNLLSEYGYAMEPTLVNGLPEIKFVKTS